MTGKMAQWIKAPAAMLKGLGFDSWISHSGRGEQNCPLISTRTL